MRHYPLILLLAGCTTAPKPATITTPPPVPKLLFRPMLAEAAHVPEPSILKALPPLIYPTNCAAFWVLQYSDDLIHWHNLARYYGDYPDECFVPPKTGNRFFRRIGNSRPPYKDEFQKDRPDLWEKLGGDKE